MCMHVYIIYINTVWECEFKCFINTLFLLNYLDITSICISIHKVYIYIYILLIGYEAILHDCIFIPCR